MNRVVVTGMGILSPIGNDLSSVLTGLRDGHSGIRGMEAWRQVKGLHSFVGGCVTGLDEKRIPRSSRRTMGKVALMATLAAEDAVRGSSLSADYLRSGRVGLAIGSTTGSPQSLAEFFTDFAIKGGIEEQLGTSFMKVMGHTTAANVAAHLGITGCVYSPTSACATSAQALGMGYDTDSKTSCYAVARMNCTRPRRALLTKSTRPLSRLTNPPSRRLDRLTRGATASRSAKGRLFWYWKTGT
jgi:3-oxoacyl-[acyl-carrier-protein] synthase II